MGLKDLKIGVRLGGGFSVLLGIIVLFVVLTAISFGRIEKASVHIEKESLPFSTLAGEMALEAVQVQQFLTDVSATREQDAMKKAEEAAGRFYAGLAKFEDMFRREGETELLKKSEELKHDFGIFYDTGKKMAAAYITGGVEAGNAIMVDFDKASEQMTKEVHELKQMQLQEASSKSSEVVQTLGTVKLVVVLLGLAALFLGIITAWIITRSITVPVHKTVSVIRRVADGDLTEKIAHQSKDEIGVLAASVNQMVDGMNGILSSVVMAAGNIASASAQLSSATQEISSGVEEVAGQACTVAAASEEMAATSSDIAANCSRAADSTRSAGQAVEKSSFIIQQTIEAIQQISEQMNLSAQSVTNLGTRSEQIGEIIGTIEDIADQTNLLALNAAIEAARAGEQGRGFAVVADEVRALATRTALATSKIAELISSIQHEIHEAVGGMEHGVEESTEKAAQAADSGRAVEGILEAVRTISDQIGQIATAAEQQNATTMEVSTNVQQITVVVEGTSKGVHESAVAAGQLAHIAEDLQSKVQRFRLAV